MPLRYAVAAQDELEAAIAHALAGAPDPRGSPTTSTVLAVVENTTDDLLVPDDGMTTLVVPEHPRAHRSAALGALLVRDGLVSEDELDAALAQQRIAGNKRLGEILVERGAVTAPRSPASSPSSTTSPSSSSTSRAWTSTRRCCSRRASRTGSRPSRSAARTTARCWSRSRTRRTSSTPDELHVVLDAPMRFVVVTPDEIDEALHHVHLEAPDVAAVAEPAVDENPWLERLDEDLLAEVGEVAETAFDSYPEIVPVHEQLAEVVELPSDTARVDDGPIAVEAGADITDVELESEPLAALHVLPRRGSTRRRARGLRGGRRGGRGGRGGRRCCRRRRRGGRGGRRCRRGPRRRGRGRDRAAREEHEAAVVHADVENGSTTRSTVLSRSAPRRSSSAPQPRGLVARCRIDGGMHELGTLEEAQPGSSRRCSWPGPVSSPPRRTAQHGVLPFTHDERTLDLAVTAVPTKLGTQLALRVPSHDGRLSVLSDLGLRPHADAALRRPARLVGRRRRVRAGALGRTTTLYAAIHEIATPDKAVATVEDPVEDSSRVSARSRSTSRRA